MSSELNGAGWFLMLPESVARDARLNKLQQNVYSELFTFQNAKPDQPIWISNNRLAAKYHVARETVSRAVSKLVTLGYVKREIVYKENSNEIKQRLIWVIPLEKVQQPNFEKKNEKVVKELSAGSDQNDTKVVTNSSTGWCQPGQRDSDRNVKENIPVNIPVNKSNTDDEQVINKSVKEIFETNSLHSEHDYVSTVTKRLLPLLQHVDSVQELNAMFTEALHESLTKSTYGKVTKPVSYAITVLKNAVNAGTKNLDQFEKFRTNEECLLVNETLPDIQTGLDLHTLDLSQL